ncbi:MAG: cytochrome c biogenesis CcdA family protein [Candidatus Hodarchaeota archaeon]
MFATQIYIPFLGFLDSTEIGLLIFFLGGLATAISPCLFPILPLSLLRMFGSESRRKATHLTTVLILGVLIAFLIIAIIISSISEFMQKNFINLNVFMGFLLIFISLFIIFPQLRELTGYLPGWHPEINEGKAGYLDVFILGFGYSFIAAPCAGSLFASLVILMVSEGNFLFLYLGFPCFALGFAIPYYILAFSSSEFRIQFAQKLSAHNNKLNILMGCLIFLFGIGMVATYFTEKPWWHEWGDDLTIFLGISLVIFTLISLIFYVYNTRIRKNTIENDISSVEDFITKKEKRRK